MFVEIKNWDATYGFNRAKDKRYHWLKMPCDFLLETFGLSNKERCLLLALLLEASKVNSSTFEFSQRVVATLGLSSDEIEKGLIAIEKAGFITRRSSTLSKDSRDREEKRREREREEILSPCSGSPIVGSAEASPRQWVGTLFPDGETSTDASPVGLVFTDSTTGEADNIDPSKHETSSSEKKLEEQVQDIEDPDLEAKSNRIFQIWTANKGELAGVRTMTTSRKNKARVRWNEVPDAAYWESCVKKMAASRVCRDGSWATFDWLITNDTNHVKVAEGKYDDRGYADVTKSRGIRSEILT